MERNNGPDGSGLRKIDERGGPVRPGDARPAVDHRDAGCPVERARAAAGGKADCTGGPSRDGWGVQHADGGVRADGCGVVAMDDEAWSQPSRATTAPRTVGEVWSTRRPAATSTATPASWATGQPPHSRPTASAETSSPTCTRRTSQAPRSTETTVRVPAAVTTPVIPSPWWVCAASGSIQCARARDAASIVPSVSESRSGVMPARWLRRPFSSTSATDWSRGASQSVPRCSGNVTVEYPSRAYRGESPTSWPTVV